MAAQSNTERVNGPMAEMFRYNGWADLRLIEACRGLTEAQLDVRIAGTYGAIRDTLVHLVNSQQAFLGRLDGAGQEVGVKPFEAWPGFDDLAREAARSSDRS